MSAITLPNRIRGSKGYDAILITILFFVFYSITRAANLSSAHDSIAYINIIDNSIAYHPHHLLYYWLARKWIQFWSLLIISSSSIILTEQLNICFGCLSLSLFYLILRARLSIRRIFALIGTTLIGFSFGFWFYSTTVEVYIIPLFFITLALYQVTRKNLTISWIIFIGCIHGIAALFHQVHILFFVVIVYVLFRKYHSSIKLVIKPISLYTVTFMATVMMPYLYVAFGIYHQSSFGQFVNWLTTYAQDKQYWHSLNVKSLVSACIGFGNAIIGGHFTFAISSIRLRFENLLSGKALSDEVFLVRHLTTMESLTLFVGSVVLVLYLSAMILYKIRFLNVIYRENKNSAIGGLIVWFITYSVFFIFWEPSNLEFWIPQSVAFWLIFISMMNYLPKKDISSIKARILGLLCVALFLLCINYFGSIRWLSHFENDYYYVKSQTIAENESEGDLIIIGDPWILKEYLHRYAKSEILSTVTEYKKTEHKKLAIERIKQNIDNTVSNNNHVFIFSDAFKPSINEKDQEFISFIAELRKDYEEKWTMIPTKLDTVYLIQGK